MAEHPPPPALPPATQASSAASSNLGELLSASCTITASEASDRRGILLLLLRHRRRHRRHGRGRQHTSRVHNCANGKTTSPLSNHVSFARSNTSNARTAEKLARRSSTAAAAVAAAAARFSIDTRTWHACTAAHVTVYDVERRKRRLSMSKPVASKSRTATPVINKTPARSTHTPRAGARIRHRAALMSTCSAAQNLNKSRQISI